jgi:hypothetical protein
MLCQDLNIEIREFTVAGISHKSMFAHKWYLGCDSFLDAEIAKKKIDFFLKELNDDYRVERLEAIKDVFVEVLPLSIFYDFLKSQGKEGGQNKFPRVLKNEKLEAWEVFINEYLEQNK